MAERAEVADRSAAVGAYWRDPAVPDEVCFTVLQGGTAHLVSHVTGKDGPVPLYARWEVTPAQWRPSPGRRPGEPDPVPSLSETLAAVRTLVEDAARVLEGATVRGVPSEDERFERVEVRQDLARLLATMDRWDRVRAEAGGAV